MTLLLDPGRLGGAAGRFATRSARSIPISRFIRSTYGRVLRGAGAEAPLLVSEVTGDGVARLTLALVGLYGLMSLLGERRTREIGIRMAIGADRGGVVRMVLKQGLLLTGIGVAIAFCEPAFGRALTAGIEARPSTRAGSRCPVGLLAMAALSVTYRRAGLRASIRSKR